MESCSLSWRHFDQRDVSCFKEDASWISEHGLGIDFTLETEINLLMNFGELMEQAGGSTLLGIHLVDLPCVPLQVDNVL